MIRLLLTAGRGPGECRLALAKTLIALAREAEPAGVELATAAGTDPDGAGIADRPVDGAGAELFAAGWVGSILWVCRSPLRPHHRRKNWFVGEAFRPR